MFINNDFRLKESIDDIKAEDKYREQIISHLVSKSKVVYRYKFRFLGSVIEKL
jgi:hypothetical protein